MRKLHAKIITPKLAVNWFLLRFARFLCIDFSYFRHLLTAVSRVKQNDADKRVIKSLSISRSMVDQSKARMIQLGIECFSQYVQHLIREDLIKRGALIRSVEDSGSGNPPPASGYSLNDSPQHG